MRLSGMPKEPPVPVLPPISEKEFMGQVVRLAKLRGWLVYHTHDSRRSVAGFPDLLLLRGRVQIVAELKSAAGKVSFEQEAWLARFAAAGVNAFVWRPADFDEIVRILS